MTITVEIDAELGAALREYCERCGVDGENVTRAALSHWLITTGNMPTIESTREFRELIDDALERPRLYIPRGARS